MSVSGIGAYKFLHGLANALDDAMDLNMSPLRVYAYIVCYNKTIKLITLN